MKTWHKLKVIRSTTIIDVMNILENSEEKIVVVVDDNDRLLGTVTDGDVRRGILKRIGVQEPIDKIMNADPIRVHESRPRSEFTVILEANKIFQLPVIDSEGRIVDLFTQNDVVLRKSKDNPVVLMAGGLGSRLEELTANCPKPMLKVGNKPILETILENLIDHGFHDFYIAVNYRAEMIEEHFKDGADWDVKITYLREKSRMGTAGALSLLQAKTQQPVVVANGDVLTKVSFSQLLANHEKHRYAASMCVRKYDIQVPFGVVQTEGEVIRNIEEKPLQSFFVNAGIYILNHETLSFIPKETYFDMTSLFSQILETPKMKAGVFPIHEYWLDVGRRDDFDRAQFEFHKVF